VDPETTGHAKRLMTGQDTWSARCGESRTPGAAGGSRETDGGNTETAPAILPNPLKVRVFDCDECPLVLDRDENAARNLAALAAEYLAQMCSAGTAVGGSLAETTVSVNVRGAGRKTRRYHPDRATGRGGRAGGVSPRKRKETSTAPSSTRKIACNGRSTEFP
jgi:hypothetical protein